MMTTTKRYQCLKDKHLLLFNLIIGTMQLKEIINYIDGDFSLSKEAKIKAYILKKPHLIETIGGLIRIKKQLPKNKTLSNYLSERRERIQKMMNK